jgi:hypothetical protein
MIRAAFGWVLVVVGAVIFIVPAMGWPGAAIAAGGGILVLRHSRWSRRNFVFFARRHPGTIGRLRRMIAAKARPVSSPKPDQSTGV